MGLSLKPFDTYHFQRFQLFGINIFKCLVQVTEKFMDEMSTLWPLQQVSHGQNFNYILKRFFGRN